MKQTVMRSWIGAMAVLAIAFGVLATPASATSIGTLSAGDSYSDTISSAGPTFSQDYDFTLAGSAGMSLLATALGQESGDFHINFLKISLYDSANNLLATASGAPSVSFDSFAQTGNALTAGNYMLNVFGNVTATQSGFVLVALAANNVSQTPLPATGLLLLTGIGGLGGLAVRRRRNLAA